ncbi:MAG: hypothetical protein HN353_00870 [Bdellovibrionales bacterium]|nr:hypothetical protein [Bdellovibrionales bacterium]MBT3526778.1 hypothetical protein [Bdellovibrionales bacterium]MBT7668904.1 hypothetical protein [Bdellovibrionales bacterium]
MNLRYKFDLFMSLIIVALLLSGCVEDFEVEDEDTISSGAGASDGSSGSGDSSGDASISGKVVTSDGSTPVSGATIYVEGQQQATTTTTESDGSFSIDNIAAGAVNLKLSKANHIANDHPINLSSGSNITNRQITLLENSVDDGDIYIITLEWSATPLDLDSYLYIGHKRQAVQNCATIISNRPPDEFPDMLCLVYDNSGETGSLVAFPNVELIQAKSNGHGPEIVKINYTGGSPDTITGIPEGRTIRMIVKNSSSGGFNNANAVVKIYKDSAFLGSYSSPSSGSGNWWNVLSLDHYGNHSGSVFTTNNLEP